MFGKSDLKTGMIVKTRNGSIYLVLKDSIFSDILVELNSGLSYTKKINLCDFTEDLKNIEDDCLDITEVAVPSVFPDIFDPVSEINDSTVVYHREDVKELTVGQLEEILGYKIKIVNGEED